jgi:hypothetical protein
MIHEKENSVCGSVCKFDLAGKLDAYTLYSQVRAICAMCQMVVLVLGEVDSSTSLLSYV